MFKNFSISRLCLIAFPLIVAGFFIFVTLSISDEFQKHRIHQDGKAIVVSFWVWNRSTPLSDLERSGLQQKHVKSLYWYAGIFTMESGHWVRKDHLDIHWNQINADCEIIPTIRLEPSAGQNLSDESDRQLIGILDQLETDSHAKMIQIDYESTDHKMASYLTFLRMLKEKGRSWRLSITGLGHWHRFIGDFQGLADEIVPMFYDLIPGRETLKNGFLPEMADTATEESFDAWTTCPISWKAALPNFSRLSVVSTLNISRGNMRSWRWDDFWYMPELTPLSGTIRGQTRFKVTKSVIVADTPLLPRETLVVRYPNLPVLQSLANEAADSGASGIIYFRMADSDDMSGLDVRDLVTDSISATPDPIKSSGQTSILSEPTSREVSLKWDSENRLTLTNESEQSLMPVVSDSGSRGYALVLDNPQGSWREAISGDFAKVTTDPAGQNQVLELGLGVTRLYFWFSNLRPKQSIHTGLVQRDSTGTIHWQIKNCEPETLWHSLN